MKKTAIIAGSKAQYHNYLIENCLSPHEHVYISDIHHLRGWLPKKIIEVGTYLDNPIFDSLDSIKELNLISSRIENEEIDPTIG